MLTSMHSSSGHFRLGDLDLDVDQHRLTRQGLDLKLSKLNYRLLHVLASAAPALVTKKELANRVWSGRMVSPETVAQRIKLLRDALHDDAQSPRYIEVVRGQGYRWIPAVEQTDFECDGSPHFPRSQISRDGTNLTLPKQPSVVVLPFDTMGDDQLDHRIFADGLTHDIITCIGRLRWIFVVARGSAFMFSRNEHYIQEVAEKLGVRYVVQGSISFSGRKISVNAALADALKGEEIWAEHFRGSIEDIFAIQEEISNRVVGSVEIEIEHAEQMRALHEPMANLDAWSAYHRGWWHLNSFSADCCEQAESFFNQSVRLEPNSARAYAGLSSVHWIRAFMELSEDRDNEIQLSLELAQQSVALDQRDPLSHWALGRAFHLRHDFVRSVAEFEVANSLNPSSSLGQFAQAFAMMHLGDNERSNKLLDSARRLSPYDPMSYAMLGVQAVNNAMLGHYDDAADLSVKGAGLLAWQCQMFPVIAAYCNVLAGRNDVAGMYFKQLQDTRPGYDKTDYFRAFPHQRDEDITKITTAFEALNQIH
jgi:TolB-like protein